MNPDSPAPSGMLSVERGEKNNTNDLGFIS